MLGCAFEQVGQEGEGVLLNDISGAFADNDEMQVASIVKGKLKYSSYYYLTEDGGMAMEGDGWYDEEFNAVGDVDRIPLGSAFWFISENGKAKSVTVSGEVRSTPFTHTLKDKKSMICSAFPVAFNPNENCTWTGFEDNDEIQVAQINKSTGKLKYTSYYYLTEDGGMAMEGTGWYDEEFSLVTKPITVVGQGFWLVLNSTNGRGFVEASPLK